ncbi:MAG: phosphotransferase [Devosia sp.]|nr:phosphotransferase [Devosia sp.]
MNQSPVETALSRALIRWSLTKAVPIAETATSWIFRVEQNGRNFAVLKILKTGKGDAEQRGGELMNWYGGEGAATVFDRHAGTLFMEWLDGIPLGDAVRQGRDEEASIALATLVGHLHRPRPDAPRDLLPLRDHFAPLFATNVRAWPYTARDLFARAAGVALTLFDRPSAQVPLHGDLHHDNIISSPRGWLAIDPRALLGDPVYEVANALNNPTGADELVKDPRRIAAMSELFSQRLGFPRKRILGWAAAHAALSACWALQHEQPITSQLAMLPLLLTAYDQA